MVNSRKMIFSMSMLLAGTALGAGILGLPMETGLAGFFPGLLAMIFCWMTLLCTGWIFIKKLTAAKYPIDDFVDLYKNEFGTWSIWLSAFGYFITFYGIITAYLYGISETFIAIFPVLHEIPYISKILIVVFFVLLTSVVLFGVKVYAKCNTFFSICLFSAFAAMVLLILFHINPENLEHVNMEILPYTLPILFTSFCFHPVIPIVCNHVKEMKMKTSSLKWILFFGTFLVFIVILFWTFVVSGVVPVYSEHGMSITLANKLNLPATIPLAKVLKTKAVSAIALLFTFFAIVTSYIGSGAGFMSFVKNFTGHYYSKRNMVTDVIFTFALPFVVALIYPNIFLKMLGVVGGVGIIIIYGFMPAFLAIKPGNSKGMKILGFCVLVISLSVFLIEIVKIFH